MKFFRSIFALPALLSLALILTGCPKKATVTPEEEQAQAEQPVEETAAPETAAAPALEIGTDWATVPQVEPVLFGYMKADLSAEARDVLKKNAATLKAVLKAAPGAAVRVEGHCDERGTLEYNMALGQRRANSVRNYYISLGLAKTAVKTVSYGEERPVCSDGTDACWAQCRRGETSLKASAPIRVPLADLPGAN